MKYIFRGLVVFDYDPDTKELTVPVDPDTGIPNLNMCKFILEDYGLLQDFLQQIKYHVEGFCYNEDLEDIEVD